MIRLLRKQSPIITSSLYLSQAPFTKISNIWQSKFLFSYLLFQTIEVLKKLGLLRVLVIFTGQSKKSIGYNYNE